MNVIVFCNIRLDCTLKGSWAEFWLHHADHGKCSPCNIYYNVLIIMCLGAQMYEVYTKLHGLKLQSYVGE